jgi:hypothetical protein
LLNLRFTHTHTRNLILGLRLVVENGVSETQSVASEKHRRVAIVRRWSVKSKTCPTLSRV